MTLPVGKYRTKAGSTMEVSSKHGGISEVSFDWVEEENACIDCQAEPYDDDGYLVWHCQNTGEYGRAKLERIDDPTPSD